MRILGIESSCDETAAAVVEDGRRLISNVVNSQIDIHAKYGGVIPEVAARSHLEVVGSVVEEALQQANVTWDDIDAIGVTYAPGLSGSLLIGTLTASTLAYLKNKPLYPVHHVEAHVYANFITEADRSLVSPDTPISSLQARSSQSDLAGALDSLLPERQSHQGIKGLSGSAIATQSPSTTSFEGSISEVQTAPAVETLPEKDSSRKGEHTSNNLNFELPTTQPNFPMLALIVSGGHTQLVLFKDHGDFELLGHTTDDAVGEAFDKVAKIIGLPYPGGPAIAKAALSGDDRAFTFPKARLAKPYDFSFSGLKTAVLRVVQREVGVDFTFPSHELPGLVNDQLRADIAASFQRIAIETLVDKAEKAFKEYHPASVVIAGGVAANQELRKQLQERLPITINYAPVQLCTDNAAMIATLAYYQALKTEPLSPFAIDITPSLGMENTVWNKQNVVIPTT